MRKKINNRDITREFLSEQYHHDTPDEVIEDVVNFLIERLYKFDPPQEILDSVQNQAALTLDDGLRDMIKLVIDRDY